MPDISYPVLLALAAITWLLTFAAALLAGAWFLWRRWSLRRWVRRFDDGLAASARRGDVAAANVLYDPKTFRGRR